MAASEPQELFGVGVLQLRDGTELPAVKYQLRMADRAGSGVRSGTVILDPEDRTLVWRWRAESSASWGMSLRLADGRVLPLHFDKADVEAGWIHASISGERSD